MKETFEIFISSIWAGIAISIGGIAFLCTKQAIFFPIGLLIVCSYQLYLFTGKIPYAKINDIPKLIFVFIGNAVGASLMGVIFGYAKPTLIESAIEICKNKLAEGWKIIPLAMLCNVMIFIAVDFFKTEDILPMYRVFVLWMATTTFVICGFEHCVANAFYFSLAGLFNLKVLIYLVTNMIWNAIGGILIYRSFYFMVDLMRDNE